MLGGIKRCWREQLCERSGESRAYLRCNARLDEARVCASFRYGCTEVFAHGARKATARRRRWGGGCRPRGNLISATHTSDVSLFLFPSVRPESRGFLSPERNPPEVRTSRIKASRLTSVFAGLGLTSCTVHGCARNTLLNGANGVKLYAIINLGLEREKTREKQTDANKNE